ncbi:hypothetical protein P7K49_027407 [Saguinus oedipus]|uniref:Uncharacterized protein n=1 Tax=Saguinus oedipus TaxID=9490 RepID=A0ABQ9UA32_SAGOE|nr:hypothetical protein P7K49_027407 [Saguinus oedipus]
MSSLGNIEDFLHLSPCDPYSSASCRSPKRTHITCNRAAVWSFCKKSIAQVLDWLGASPDFLATALIEVFTHQHSGYTAVELLLQRSGNTKTQSKPSPQYN